MKLPNGIVQVFGDNVRGNVAQVNRVLLQLSEESTRIEAIIVNDCWAVTLPVQGVAKF